MTAGADDEVLSGAGLQEIVHVDEHADATVPGEPRSFAEQLPYNRMTWSNFERLLKRIPPRELGWDQTRIYGDPGQTQYGIDVIGLQPDGTWGTIQTKRYEAFDEKDFAAAVKKFDPDGLPIKGISRFIIATSIHTNRRQILEKKEELQAQCDVKLEFWDGSDLDDALRRHADLVAEFFGSQTATDFCGYVPRLVEPPTPERAVVADLVMRGPSNDAEVKATLTRAQAAEKEDHPGEAARAYAEAQALLRAARFGSYARVWDDALAKNLVAAGHYRDAAIALADAYWAAVTEADRGETEIVARRLDDLARSVPAEAGGHGVVERIAGIIATAERLNSTPLGLVDQVLPGLDLPSFAAGFEEDGEVVAYVAELGITVAQTALSNPMDRWAQENAASLRDVRGMLTPAIGDGVVSTDLGLRLDIELAAATDDWTALLLAVRKHEYERGACALISARAALARALTGDFEGAEELWLRSIELACLEGHFGDAAEWSYACRNAQIAHAGPFGSSDNYRRNALALQQLGGGPLQPALRRIAERTGHRHLDGKTRGMALAARDYARRAYAAGSWRQYAHAHELLGRVYRDSSESLAAVASLITAGQIDMAVEAAARAGDEWLDIRAFLASPSRQARAASFRVLAERADLIPDTAVASLEAAAMEDARPPLSGVPQAGWGWDSLYLAALRLLAGLAQRLSPDTAAELVDLLEPLVPREPGKYRHSDEWHVQILTGVAHSYPHLRLRAITQLVDLATAGGASHYVRRRSIGLLRTYRDDAVPLLRGAADAGEAEALRLLALVAADPAEVFPPEDIEAARIRVLTPPVYSPGVRTFGTRIGEDTVVLNDLPSADRSDLVSALITHAENEPSPKWHAQDYLWASVDLARELGPAADLFARALGIADGPSPESHGLPESPLAAFQITGIETDPRPAAATVAARLATTPEERASVQRTCLMLLAAGAIPAHHLAWAFFFAYGDNVAEVLPMLASQAESAYRALAAQQWPGTAEAEEYVGFRLARDPDPMVRRTLAAELVNANATRPLTEAERRALDRLAKDARYSVRQLATSTPAPV